MLTVEQLNDLKPGDMVRHSLTGSVAEFCCRSNLDEDFFVGITVSISDDYLKQKVYSDWLIGNCEIVEKL